MKVNLIGLLVTFAVITTASLAHTLEMQGIWRGTIYSVAASSIPSSYVGQQVEIRSYWDSATLTYYTWNDGVNHETPLGKAIGTNRRNRVPGKKLTESRHAKNGRANTVGMHPISKFA